MKIYISADIEGVTGITDWEEANLERPANAEFRERMTAEVIAACEGALEAGATEILVKDSHSTGRNLLAERLPREANLVRGWSGHPYCMVQGVDDSFAAALFIGWHSGGARGGNPLAHTLSSSRLNGIRVNGELVAEFHLHAWACALEEVPVAFVSGDEQLCDDVRRYDETIETVAVHRGDGASTTAMHPFAAREAIRTGVASILGTDLQQLSIDVPDSFELEVLHKEASAAYRASFYPGARLAEPNVVAYETEDAFDLLRALRFVT